MEQPVQAGEVVHVRFWARNVQSMTGSARLAAVVEQAKVPHAKLMDLPVTVGSDWQCVDLPFVANRSYPAGEWQFSIRVGYAAQVLQIAGVEIRNYGKSLDIQSLPRMRLSYDGREADAPWRKAALDRIEKIRKEDLSIQVIDSTGQPIADATVHAVLSKNAFGFGTCVSMKLLDNDADAERYRQTLKELFNCVVIENELKWPSLVKHGYARTDRLIGWLRENDLAIRGHVLLWPSARYLPKQAVDLKDRQDELRQLIARHITETVSRYRGQLIDWDVINEPFAHHDAMAWLGNAAMVEWFRLAHAADPEAKLYINDYEILASGDMLNTTHQNHYFNTIQYLLAQGAPVHGIGMQGHFGSNITSPGNLLKILDRFASLGLRIKVTEMDLAISDEELRADYYRDFLITLYSHPSVDAVMQWGFWEGSHWIPASAIIAKDWTYRPHGKMFLELMKGWKTDVTLRTDAAGRCEFRGFLGEYEIKVVAGGKTLRKKYRLPPGAHTLKLEVK